MNSIEWDPKARDFLRKLQKDTAKRIFEKVDCDIKNNIVHYLKSLVGTSAKKIRIGDHRLFVDYDEKNDRLFIRSIRHRRDAYK